MVRIGWVLPKFGCWLGRVAMHFQFLGPADKNNWQSKLLFQSVPSAITFFMSQPRINKPAAGTAKWIDILFAAAVLAHLPVGYEYCRRMWSVEHYQFFPLLMLAAGWMIADRLMESKQRAPKSRLNYWLLLADLVLLTLASLMFSPFFWILSVLLLIVVYVYDRWGWQGVRRTSPAWLLLLFVVPLPMNLDLKLVNKLQFLSSQLASYILDAFGQVHFREGVILITEKKQFFTEEACSGIRSLFSSVSAMAIFGVMMRYGWKRHLFNLIQTIVWVIIGNSVRIALVVYLTDNVSESFAEGTTHELLGLANFVFVFMFALSTDRGINAWHAATADETRSALDSDVEEPVIDGVVVSPVNPLHHVTNRPAIWQWSLVIGFVLVGLFAARLAYAKSKIDNFRFDETTLVELYEGDLPKRIGGWKQINFVHQDRDDTRLLAPESYVWTFITDDNRRAIVSLDSPYFDFHNLTDCYEGFGWNVDFENRYPAQDNEMSEATNLTELKMEKSGEHGLVLFTAFDRDGTLVRPTFDLNYDPTRWMEIVRHVRMVFGLLNQKNDPRFSGQTLPISQVQVLHVGNQKILDTSDVEQLFVEVRARLQESSRFGN